MNVRVAERWTEPHVPTQGSTPAPAHLVPGIGPVRWVDEDGQDLGLG